MKTLTSEEVEQMHLLLKQYHPYVVERHGKHFIPILFWKFELWFFSDSEKKKDTAIRFVRILVLVNWNFIRN